MKVCKFSIKQCEEVVDALSGAIRQTLYTQLGGRPALPKSGKVADLYETGSIARCQFAGLVPIRRPGIRYHDRIGSFGQSIL